jgi:HEAT repeat protein
MTTLGVPAGDSRPDPNPRRLGPDYPTETTSSAAIWSLVLAILGFFFFPLLPVAIVLGHVARAKCKKIPGLKGKGVALTGLIFSYGLTALFVAVGASLIVAFKSWQADLPSASTKQRGAQVTAAARTQVQIEADPQVVQAYIERVERDVLHPIDRQLAGIDSEFSYLDRDVFERYPERALSVLVKLVEDDHQYPRIRSDAVLILLSLDPQQGKHYLQHLLGRQDGAFCKTVFHRLNVYADLAKRHAEWLEPFILKKLQQTDSEMVQAAIEAAACVATPALNRRLSEMLAATKDKAPDDEVAERLIDALAGMGSNDATVDALLRRLKGAEKLQYDHKKMLANCFRWASPMSKQKLRAFLRERYRAGDEGAMQILCDHADMDCLPLIQAYFDDPATAHRSEALRAIVRLKGAAALPVLQAAFKDKQLCHAAVAAAADSFAGSGDPTVLNALAELNQDDFYAKPAIVAAAMAVSPEETALVVREIVSTKSYADYQGPPIFWYFKKITVETALADFINAGLIEDRSYADEIAAVRAEYNHYSPYDVFLNVLEQTWQLAWFDVEVGTYPVPHDNLVHQLARISAGRFQAAHIDQTVVGDPERDETLTYKLQWICGDRLYTVAPQDHGDWYDLGTIIDGANTALEDNGRKERFLLLNTGDQTAQVIFGDQATLEAMAAKYQLPLVTDAAASMERGKAFEAEVRRLLTSKAD